MSEYCTFANQVQLLNNQVHAIHLFRNFLPLTCLLCVFAIIPNQEARSQAPSTSYTRNFVDNSDFPARIGYMPLGAYYTIENHSQKRIIRYRLGCVIEKHKRYKVVSRKNHK